MNYGGAETNNEFSQFPNYTWHMRAFVQLGLVSVGFVETIFHTHVFVFRFFKKKLCWNTNKQQELRFAWTVLTAQYSNARVNIRFKFHFSADPRSFHLGMRFACRNMYILSNLELCTPRARHANPDGMCHCALTSLSIKMKIEFYFP